jgi:hypothetical protein
VEAVRIETPLGPVYRSAQPPQDHYTESFDDGAYWLPGVTEPTSLEHKALRAGRLLRGRGKASPLRVRELRGFRVYTTEGKPSPGIHSLPGAGELWVWIAGVGRPTPEQRTALEAVAKAEGATEIPPPPPVALPPDVVPPPIPPEGVLGAGKTYPEPSN